MHQACPLYAQLLTYRCGAANRRFGPKPAVSNRSKGSPYSITSAAAVSSDSGTSSPIRLS
jgi:hypothetical protein